MKSQLCLVLALSCALSAHAESPRETVDAAGARLWQGLSETARSEAKFAFEDEERRDIRFAPMFQEGLRLDSLQEENQSRVHGLLEASLGAEGAARTRAIRDLEPAVARIEQGSMLGFLFGNRRLPGRYFLAFFGEPGEASWGYRFEGHHLSVNVTVPANGRSPSLTPLFLGAQPRRVHGDWEGGGVQVLQREEEAALELIGSLDPAQRTVAELSYEGDRALMLTQVRDLEAGEGAGIMHAALDGRQRQVFEGLIDLYLANFPASTRAEWWKRIDAAGRGYLQFAFARSDEPEHALYFRIQGPTFMVEFDNTEDGDHIHTLVRSFDGDFGADLLAEHYRREHQGHLAHR